MGDGKGFGSENIEGALPRIISQFDICMETSSSLSMSKLVVEKAFPTGLIKLKNTGIWARDSDGNCITYTGGYFKVRNT